MFFRLNMESNFIIGGKVGTLTLGELLCQQLKYGGGGVSTMGIRTWQRVLHMEFFYDPPVLWWTKAQIQQLFIDVNVKDWLWMYKIHLVYYLQSIHNWFKFDEPDPKVLRATYGTICPHIPFPLGEICSHVALSLPLWYIRVCCIMLSLLGGEEAGSVTAALANVLILHSSFHL